MSKSLSSGFFFILSVAMFCPLWAGSTISGTVTGGTENIPLEGIRVNAYILDGWWDWAGEVVSDEDGNYTLVELSAGTYRLIFEDDSGNFVSAAYGGGLSLWPGGDGFEDILVSPDEVVSGIHINLEIAAKIHGKVTMPDKLTPLEDIWVSANRWNGEWFENLATATTSENGGYFLAGLPSGLYKLEFHDFAQNFLGAKFHEDGIGLHAHTPLEIEGGEILTLRDMHMQEASSITVHVFEPDGITPVEDAWFVIHKLRPSGNFVRYKDYDFASDPNGKAHLKGLSVGVYRLEAFSAAFGRGIYGGGQLLENGLDIQLGVSSQKEGLEIILSESATITGKILDDAGNGLEGILVDIYSAENGYWGWVPQQVTVETDELGRYEFSGLSIGEYHIQTRGTAPLAMERGETREQWIVQVSTPGEHVENVDRVMRPTGSLVGKIVSSEDGAPLESISVFLYWFYDDEWVDVDTAFTDENGNFTFQTLEGEYRITFHDYYDGFASKVLGNVDTIDDGTAVMIDVSSDTDLGEIALSPGYSISGQLLNPDGEPFESWLEIVVYRRSGPAGDEIWTEFKPWLSNNQDGSFEADGLPLGSYKLKFRAVSHGTIGIYQDTFYGNTTEFDEATVLELIENASIEGLTVEIPRLISRSEIESISYSDSDGFQVSLYSSQRVPYVLQYAEDLGGPWLDFGRPVVSENGSAVFETPHPGSSPTLFLRVREIGD